MIVNYGDFAFDPLDVKALTKDAFKDGASGLWIYKLEIIFLDNFKIIQGYEVEKKRDMKYNKILKSIENARESRHSLCTNIKAERVYCANSESEN